MQRLSAPGERSIGERVREKRIAQSLTVRELARLAGVSASMISGIENDAKSPSIGTLMALAQALGMSLSQLVDDTPRRSGGLLRLPKSAHRIVTDASGVSREHFEPSIEGSRLEFVRFVLPPQGATGDLAPHAPGSLEHAHVSAGSAEVLAGDESITAEEGDTVVFQADQRHAYRNTGPGELAIYVVVEPPARSENR